jgi:16S rRNA (guanine(966)-N(2))-methyltransferase RsmD
MRITGGSAKGQIIKTPQSAAVRPTTDKVREAAFSILGALANNWDRALDLFAGTGALGIEALSRDVGWVDFVDQNSKCCLVIKQNLSKTGFIDKAHVYCCPVMKAIGFLEHTYDMVFVDPPYADNSLKTLIPALSKANFISADSVILVSHASRNILDQQYGSLLKIKEKRYGDTCISIYQKEVIS